MVDLAKDIILAAAHLVERSGGAAFDIGFTGEEDSARPDWYASAYFRGRRLIAEGHRTPTAAALALTEIMLPGANCRCGEVVSLDDSPGCRWYLIRDRWTPGCDAPPLKIQGEPGDLDAMADTYRAVHGRDPR